MRTGTAGWDYDVQAQSIQARLLDLNSIMPGALRRLDMSRFAAATARLVGSSSLCILLLLCVCQYSKSDVLGNTLPLSPSYRRQDDHSKMRLGGLVFLNCPIRVSQCEASLCAAV